MNLRRVRSERIATGSFLALDRVWVADPDGRESPRDVIDHPGGVAVLPLDGDVVILVRQYRVAVDQVITEIPAGRIDPTDATPEDAARRELAEELGATPVRLIRLGTTLVSPGYTSERIHLFAAEGILWGQRRPEGAEERTAQIIRVPWEETLSMVENGEITDAKTQIAIGMWSTRSRK